MQAEPGEETQEPTGAIEKAEKRLTSSVVEAPDVLGEPRAIEHGILAHTENKKFLQSQWISASQEKASYHLTSPVILDPAQGLTGEPVSTDLSDPPSLQRQPTTPNPTNDVGPDDNLFNLDWRRLYLDAHDGKEDEEDMATWKLALIATHGMDPAFLDGYMDFAVEKKAVADAMGEEESEEELQEEPAEPETDSDDQEESSSEDEDDGRSSEDEPEGASSGR